MKVQIEGDMYLESDNFQFIIKEYTGAVSVNKDTGKETEVYNTHGYFPSLESALKFLLKKKIKESTATRLQDLINDVRRIEKWIHEQLGEIA